MINFGQYQLFVDVLSYFDLLGANPGNAYGSLALQV